MSMVHVGDCLEVMRTMDANSVDAVVTDPPYGLSFMGKKWDYDVPTVEVWAECLRVLKPGGHLLAFAGTRTQHRMAVRIEDAGFEIRDMIAWVYGSGFPKSLDVSKAIDKAAGAERERDVIPNVRSNLHGDRPWMRDPEYRMQSKTPATDDARRWQGWGTALKPAMEPITVARKPLVGTVAANVLEFGTGAVNVDGCRVEGGKRSPGFLEPGTVREMRGTWNEKTCGFDGVRKNCDESQGRWPANLIHDGSDEVVAGFPQTTSGDLKPYTRATRQGNAYGKKPEANTVERDGDSGSAARFFYCAKASGKDRGDDNKHPTVKPTELMRYLCRLVTPTGGLVLDPFTGSGSTGKAALLEGFRFVGIEREAEYAAIARARIESVGGLFPQGAGFPVPEIWP